MKLTYLFVVLIYFITFIRIFKNRSNKDYVFISTLIASTISLPGFLISNIMVNMFDIIVPLFFILLILIKRKILFDKLSISFFFLGFVSLISVVSYCLRMNVFEFSMILKSIRLFFIPMSYLIFKTCYSPDAKKMYEKDLILYIFLFNFISILAFIEQGTIYDSIQSMWIGKYVLKRAGGIYAESSALGFMSILIFSFSFYQIKKNKSLMNYLNLILSVVCNIISYTRISNLALIVIVFFLFLKKLLKMKIKIGMILSIIFCMIVIVCFSMTEFGKEFIFERMFSIDISNLDGFTSGRLTVWSNNIDYYMKEQCFLFGCGYKNPELLGDNVFIFSLVQMGIVGLFTVIMIIVLLFSIAFKNRKCFGLIFIGFILMTLTCDVITYYRQMSFWLMILILENILFKQKVIERKGDFCNEINCSHNIELL